MQREAATTLTAERGACHRTGAVMLQENKSNAHLTPVCHHNGRSVLVIKRKALLGQLVDNVLGFLKLLLQVSISVYVLTL